MNLFNDSLTREWKQVAGELGAEYTEGTWKTTDVVSLKSGPWTITLDSTAAALHDCVATITRMSADYICPDGFEFTIYRAGKFSALAHLVGMQDIMVGDEGFDRAYVIKSNNPGQVNALLSDERLRELFMKQPVMRITVHERAHLLGEQPDPTKFTIHFEHAFFIDTVDHLRDLFALFVETLNKLVEIGSALPQ